MPRIKSGFLSYQSITLAYCPIQNFLFLFLWFLQTSFSQNLRESCSSCFNFWLLSIQKLRKINFVSATWFDFIIQIYIKASNLATFQPAILFSSSILEGLSGPLNNKDYSKDFKFPLICPEQNWRVGNKLSFKLEKLNQYFLLKEELHITILF